MGSKARDISCEDCLYTRQMFSKKPPDCVKCGFVIVIPGNYEVVELLMNYSSILVDGMGSISTVAIDKIMEWENIQNKKTIINKLILYLKTSLQVRNEEQQNGPQNNARIRSN